MTKKKLSCFIVAAVVAVLVAFGFWYTRPVDVYGIDGEFSPEIISISLVRTGEEERFAYFEAGDPGYDEALAAVNALRFRRPITNLIPALADSTSPSGDSCDYSIYLHLGEQGKDWAVYLSCFNGNWDYWDAGRKVSLPLTPGAVADDPQALGNQWWDIATPLDSFDIENLG